MASAGQDRPHSDKDLESRIDTLMGEFRMLTPGVAALFGFQLTVAFQQSFRDLSSLEKGLNFAALACSALAFLLLLVPAHHHRTLHRLRLDEEFLDFAKRFIVAGSAFVAVAIASTMALQAMRAFGTLAHGAAAAAATLLLFGVGWWLYPESHARHVRNHPRSGSQRPTPGRRPSILRDREDEGDARHDGAGERGHHGDKALADDVGAEDRDQARHDRPRQRA